MSTLLIEELSRDRMRTLLREAEDARRAREAARPRPGRVRQATGRWLISAGARLAGPEVARVMR